MKPATSNLACSWGLPRPIMKSHLKKSVCGPGLGELPEIWGFPFNISAMAEASNFKFGTQLGFAKDYHKITCRRKRGHGRGLGELPKIGGSPSIFTQWRKLATSNLVHRLGLPRPIIKSHQRKKWGWPWLGELPYIWGSPFICLQLPCCSLSISGASC